MSRNSNYSRGARHGNRGAGHGNLAGGRGVQNEGSGRQNQVRGGRNQVVGGRNPGRGGRNPGRGGRNQGVDAIIAGVAAINVVNQQQQQQQQDAVDQMLQLGLQVVGFPLSRQNVSRQLNERRFRSFFGVGPGTVVEVINKIEDRIDGEVNKTKLLMALNWLKLYDPEGVLAARWNLSEETLRVQIREHVELIASLRPDVIEFGPFGDEVFIASVDGTHCPIFEPRCDPSSKWYSHKFHAAGLSYELAISIRSNKLVWLNVEERNLSSDIVHRYRTS